MNTAAKISRIIGDAASWAALGDVFGRVLAVSITASHPEMFALRGGLIGVLVALVLAASAPRESRQSLEDRLVHADDLFALCLITNYEHGLMRAESIKKATRK